MKRNYYLIWGIGATWLLAVVLSAVMLQSYNNVSLIGKAPTDASTSTLAVQTSDSRDSIFIVSNQPILRGFSGTVKKQTADSLEERQNDNLVRTHSDIDHFQNEVSLPQEESYGIHKAAWDGPLENDMEPDLQQQMHSPVLIVYPDELVFEFPKQVATTQNIKRAMARLLLSQDPFSEQDWLSTASLSLNAKPFFYKKVLDHKERPIRYPLAVYDYVEYLLNQATLEDRGKEGEFVLFHIPVIQGKTSEAFDRYNPVVQYYATQFNIPADLIFAIMEVESNFNPRAVSRSNAMGLMQLKANTAGKDVYKKIDNRPGVPSKDELFDPENNIRMGVAYAGLLNNDYLDGIRNKESKEMLLISSYNGGLSTVLKLFGDSPEESIQRINQLHPRQVYRSLRYQHASSETRAYLDKVLKTKLKYSEMLDLNV